MLQHVLSGMAAAYKLKPARYHFIMTMAAVVAVVAASLGVAYRPDAAQAVDAKRAAWNAGMYTAQCPIDGFGKPVVIRQGSRGGCVKAMQRFLNRWNTVKSATSVTGFDKATNQLVEDGIFGPATAQQVGDFQDYARFVGYPTGRDIVVGPTTWAAVYDCMDASLGATCHRGTLPGTL